MTGTSPDVYWVGMCRIIVETKECPEFEATEIILSNGMRVCYKSTGFNDDEVSIPFVYHST